MDFFAKFSSTELITVTLTKAIPKFNNLFTFSNSSILVASSQLIALLGSEIKTTYCDSSRLSAQRMYELFLRELGRFQSKSNGFDNPFQLNDETVYVSLESDSDVVDSSAEDESLESELNSPTDYSEAADPQVGWRIDYHYVKELVCGP
ncbi:hypothetical protein LENED_005971 [Lentinula edodes]|uniref:Uncharacterized protein n=1 Tax=Lentinula edodes TaxID=5353 RepID=A0A1Q3EAD7_LENED|nr:hypothetical protein LENED_005971 [Lentinula edodes]